MLCLVCLPHDHGMRFLPSPNYGERPDDSAIDLIVLHAISLPPGQFETEVVEAFFLGKLDTEEYPELMELKGVRVSAHFVVDRKGGITQFVPLSKRAWHAGESSWQGLDDCNNYSIGIEVIGDEVQPFTSLQYRETARLCRVLMQHFPLISRERIVGHQDVAPGRKWDPGEQWSWERFDRSFSHIRKLNIEAEV